MDRPGLSSRENSPAGRVSSRPNSVGGLGSLSPGSIDDRIPKTPPPKERNAYTTSQATQTLSDGEVDTNDGSKVLQASVLVPEREVMVFSVGVQTNEPWGKDDAFSDDELNISATNRSPRSLKRLSRRDKQKEDELRQNLRKEIEEELKALKDLTLINGQDSNGQTSDGTTQPRNFFNKALTTEEMDVVVSSDEFLDFVNRSSKVIERALDEEYDVLADYAITTEEYDEDDEGTNGYGRMRDRKGRRLKEIAQFYDERWCKKRMISDINFSPKVVQPPFHSHTLTGYSFLSCFSHLTQRIHLHLRIHQVYYKSGIYIYTHVLNTHFIAHQIS